VGTIKVTNVTGFSFAPSNDASYTSIVVNTSGPNYFFPDANLYAYITNPYAKYVENFTVYESTDNSTWVQIPISDNPNIFTKIGTVPLNGFSTTIYYKIYFPIQNLLVLQNQTLSFYQFGESFVNGYLLNPLPTPQTTVIFILLIIAVFSFVLQIVDFLFRNEAKTDSSTKIKQNKLELSESFLSILQNTLNGYHDHSGLETSAILSISSGFYSVPIYNLANQ